MNGDRGGIQTIFLFIFIAALGVGVYFFLQYQDLLKLKVETPSTELEAKIVPLRRVRNVTLDTSIFDDPMFKNLKPPELPRLDPIQPGRANPFLPVRFTQPNATNTPR